MISGMSTAEQEHVHDMLGLPTFVGLRSECPYSPCATGREPLAEQERERTEFEAWLGAFTDAWRLLPGGAGVVLPPVAEAAASAAWDARQDEIDALVEAVADACFQCRGLRDLAEYPPDVLCPAHEGLRR